MPDAPQFVIRGTVKDANQVPAPGMLVRAVDRDLRKEESLGTAQTDASGQYQISYKSEQFGHAESATADIIVRVFTDEKATKPSAESPMLMNVGKDITVDLVLSGPGLPEWNRITNAVTPLLVGQGESNEPLPPAQLNDADLTFIAGETGLGLDLLQLWVLAAQQADQQPSTMSAHLLRAAGPDAGSTAAADTLRTAGPNVPPAAASDAPSAAAASATLSWQLLYGWFRDGQPRTYAELIRRSTNELMASLARAADKNYIAAIDGATLKLLRLGVDAGRVTFALKPAGDSAPASLGDALRLIPDADRLQLDSPNGPGQKLSALLVVATRDNPPSWDARLQAVGDEGLLRSAQRSISLWTLTGGFVPWMRELQKSGGDKPDPTLADLVSKDTNDWIKFAQKNGVPADVTGATDEEKFTRYGSAIAERIQRLHPTLYVQNRIATGRIRVADSLKKPIDTFLTANPKFRLRETPLLVYRASADFNAGGLSDDALSAITPELTKVERLATLVATLDHVGPLLSANYDSARAIVMRRSRNAFVTEMSVALGGDAKAAAVYNTAAGVASNTEALLLRQSPRFTGLDLPVIPSQQSANAVAPEAVIGGVVLPPNLQQLFGNQDYCECAHGASLYGAAAYFADLLQMLSRTPQVRGETALQVLLTRRPDLADIDLTGDNTDIRFQYIDLVLEIIEQPEWNAGLGFRVIRGDANGMFDGALDQGTVPPALLADIATYGVTLGDQLTAGRGASVLTAAGATFQSWLIRDLQSGFKVRLLGVVPAAYRMLAFPQSIAGAPKGYRPWSTLISSVARNTASARFPWRLPFDVNRDEANAWLQWLGATREDVLLALTASGARWTDTDAACERLGLNPVTRAIFTTAPDATHPDYADWGFPNATVGAEGVVDPIAGMQGTLVGAQINWSGAETRPPDPRDWYALLKNVSLLRSRSELTHRDLLNVLEMRFTRAGGPRFDVTGAECDSALMRLESFDAPLARRIHLFVRLWRLLGWTVADVDAAINARAAHGSGAGTSVALSQQCLLFLGNIARLTALSRLPVSICLDLFSGNALDTSFYWDHNPAQPTRTLSRYEVWFDNSTVGKPRVPEFQLNPARNGLTAITVPATGLPRVRISDHLTYVAAALGMPESELSALLPVGIAWLPPTQVAAATNSAPVRVSGAASIVIEVLLGSLSAGATFNVTIQESTDGAAFQNVDAAHLSVANPWPIAAGTAMLTRFTYSGGKPFLSLLIAPTAGANPSVWITVRVLRAPGRVDDELSLVNLTTLCKYAVLRRLTGASIVDVLTLLRLSGVDPIAAAATPDSALALLDARDTVAGLGMSVSDADQLLSGPTGTPADDLQKEAAALLDTARSANLAILNESTVTPDHRSVLLVKILTDFNWDSARIADVSSVTHLGLSWDNYQAPLAALPVGTALPALITLDANAQLLMALVTVRPTALRAALAPLLVNATGALRTALTTLDQQAADRETELALLQTLLREKTPQTFTTDWSIPASVPLAIPAEWQGRFYYERAAGKLCFVGWMSPDDQAALIQLGPSLNVGMSVPTFDAAINALFDQSRQYVPSAINGLVVRQPAAGLTVETLLLDTTGLQDRCGLLLDRLLPDWRLSQQRAKLRDALADSVSCPPESADALLSLSITVATAGGPVQKSGFDWLAQDALLASDPVTATTRAAFPDTFDAGAQLLVLGQLVTKLALDAARVPWLRGSWTGLELKQLPTTRITGTRADLWTALGALSKLATLKKNRNLDVTALPDVLSASNQPAIDYASLADTLDGTEANLRDLAAARALNINSSPWLRDPLQLAQLVKCLDLCREMRIPAALLVSVGRAQALARPLSEAEGEARSLRQVALSGSSRGSWPDDEKSVLDQIRQRRRDASVEYLVQSRQVRDANDLYGYYLIDPQMGPCMETSRIVQAISSVQLFIQRAFMGLEPGVPAASLDKQQWSWMKNYRVWEANRKVLLYAENWIAPELRDDKTPFFDDVVSALQQGDATSAKAEAAVQTFLEKLTDFSKMEIVATCSSYDDENRLLLSHVFARTRSEPRAYYYRKFRNLNPASVANSLGTWTPWQALDLDIEGDHLLPFVWQGRLFLFWAIFSKQSDEPSETDLQNAKDTPVSASKFWALKLAWSEYKSGAWTSRRVSQPDLSIVRVKAVAPTRDMANDPSAAAVDTADQFFFWVSAKDEGVTLEGLFARFQYDAQRAGRWVYKPFTTSFFDGHNVVKAGGAYTLGNNFVYTLTQSPTQQAEAPVDATPPATLRARSNMMWPLEVAFPVSLDQPSGGTVLLYQSLPRRVSLLYAPQVPDSVLSAPSVFSGLPVGPANITTPFIASDRLHQLFVLPSRELEMSFVPGPVPVGGFATLLILLTEVPKLHFYGLDWSQATRLRRTFATAGFDALFSFAPQDPTQNPPVPYMNDYAIPADLISAAPNGDLEFAAESATATYNYELFFHVPFAVACALSKNQRFEEARQWFHYIFDPTDTSTDPTPQRYWRFRPFRDSPGLQLTELITRLADPSDHSLEKLEFQSLIAQWKDDPFKPHLVARMRLRSYMYAVVMKYLDNLIEWADQLFRRDTFEALNEATQLYVLAAQILGRRPESLPHRTRPVVLSYTELAASHPDDLTNALVDAENLIPTVPPGSGSTPQLQSLYFCIPNNPHLLDYYDRVDGQLYKLRNCMNIDGVVRELPLFAPEIDPGLLVRAAAAGIDIASALADLQAPLPLYRFSVMVQKASELCSEVKALGAALLSVIEKGDAEALARLRSGHEIALLKAVRLVKEGQLQEAKSALDALGDNMQSAQTKFAHYVGLVSQLEPLSIPTGPVVGPTLADLASAAVETLTTATSFMQAVTSKVDPIGTATLDTLKQMMARAADALAPSLPPESMATARVPMNDAERHQLDELKSGHDLQTKAADQRTLAGALAMIPDFTLGAQGFASSPVVQFAIGGTLLSKVANFAASVTDSKATEHSYRATLHSMLAGYQRRAADWLLQAQLASWEIAQIGDQVKAGTLRIALATQELRNHDLQAANTQEADDFMRSKFSNQELFNWMSGQLSSLYFQTYQLAYDVAKRAERCFTHELGVDASFIQFGYWDSLKKGMLAGERLHADLKRMEIAYLNQNARELEITKHVSLLQLDPSALVQLRETGECEITIPEVLFDLDFPGHYFRRIKNVSISIPCVAGPYTGLSSTLTLLTSKIRVKSAPANQSYTDDQNFRQSALPTRSIATSTGQNDSGMFELNFRDDRYLPFEGHGVIGTWRLSMPQKFRPFDYTTISDVLLHMRYTARDAGGVLKKAAQDAMVAAVNAIGAAQSGFNRLFSLNQEFPSEWSRFVGSGRESKVMEFALTKRRFPFLFTGKGLKVKISKVGLLAVPAAAASAPVDLPATLKLFSPTDVNALQSQSDLSIGPLQGKIFDAGRSVEVKEKDTDARWKLTLAAADVAAFADDVADVLLICGYTVENN